MKDISNKQVLQPTGLMGSAHKLSVAVTNLLITSQDFRGARRHVPVKDASTDTDLPVWQLPDHLGVYIGFNPPTPSQLGYGTNDD